MSSLRSILSTGSPLAPESYDYVYRKFKPDVQLASISGGTDIISCFALGNPMLPVYSGELQCRGLGMDVAIFNEQSQPVVQQKGELVCKSPFPSMPVCFWNDKDHQKYKSAYFEKHFLDNKAVWAHGDYAELTQHGGLIIHGRADAVLNPGGVRIGTAEIYRLVENLPEVMESIAVGQDWQQDVRIILFVKLKQGINLNEKLCETIKQTIKTHATPRHVPAKILQVADIPRTISGKITELAVKNVINGLPVTNTDALANPEALAHFKNLPELTS
jgi:acetoacetyl-CoA synthetase